MRILRVDGVAVRPMPTDQNGHVSLEHVMADLGSEPRAHVLVEPGPTLARAFFGFGLADRVWRIRSPMRVDDVTAPAAAPVPLAFLKAAEIDLAGDTLTEFV